MSKQKETLPPIDHEIRTLERRIERNQKKVDEIMNKAKEQCSDLDRVIRKDRVILDVLKKSA